VPFGFYPTEHEPYGKPFRMKKFGRRSGVISFVLHAAL
jgi:hypothetical protein